MQLLLIADVPIEAQGIISDLPRTTGRQVEPGSESRALCQPTLPTAAR